MRQRLIEVLHEAGLFVTSKLDALGRWVDEDMPVIIDNAVWFAGIFWQVIRDKRAELQAVFRKSPTVDLKLSVIVGSLVIFILWWVLGVWMPMNHNSQTLTGAGNYGDMFGGVNALFSGFALFAITLTLVTQMKEIQRNARAQQEGLEITRITARIQALSDFADLHLRSMHTSPAHLQSRLQLRAIRYLRQATLLMQQLGEKTDFGLHDSPLFLTELDFAASEITTIKAQFENDVAEQGVSTESNAQAIQACRTLCLKLERWQKDHQSLALPNSLNEVLEDA